MRQVLKVSDRMTQMPISVKPELPIQEAWTLMRSQQIRHLPVEEAGRFLGVISERALRLASSYEGADRMTARDVMASKPLKVAPGTPLYRVALDMAESRSGSAVVLDGEKVVGIFTTLDALRALGEILEEEANQAA